MRLHRGAHPRRRGNLPRNLCPLIKASYGFALTDTCPYFYFSDLVVGETTCDGKKKMFELLRRSRTPMSCSCPTAGTRPPSPSGGTRSSPSRRSWRPFTGITITEDDIRQAIKRKNRERDVMLRYPGAGQAEPGPHEPATRWAPVWTRAVSPFDLDQCCNIIEARTAEVLEQWKASKDSLPIRSAPSAGYRLPQRGCAGEDHQGGGGAGADVVAFDTCNGIREKVEKVDESDPDVYHALAVKYLNINCSVRAPTKAAGNTSAR